MDWEESLIMKDLHVNGISQLMERINSISQLKCFLHMYAKTWEKVNHICASQEMIHQSHEIFSAHHLPFPNFLTGTASSVQPCQGVINIDPTQPGPASISVELWVSHGPLLQLPAMTPPAEAPLPEIQQLEPELEFVRKCLYFWPFMINWLRFMMHTE